MLSCYWKINFYHKKDSKIHSTSNFFLFLFYYLKEKQMNIIDIADVGANQNQIAFVPLKVNKKVS